MAVPVRTDPDRHHAVRPPSVELAEADDRRTGLNWARCHAISWLPTRPKETEIETQIPAGCNAGGHILVQHRVYGFPGSDRR